MLAPGDGIGYVVTSMSGPVSTLVGTVESLKVRVGNYRNVRKVITLQYLPGRTCIAEGPTTKKVEIEAKENLWVTFQARTISGGMGRWGRVKWRDEKGEEREGGDGGFVMAREKREGEGEESEEGIRKEEKEGGGNLETVSSF